MRRLLYAGCEVLLFEIAASSKRSCVSLASASSANMFDQKEPMKKICMCFVLFAVPSVSQISSKPSSQYSSPALTNSFAKSGLRLAKMIEGEQGAYDVGSDGGIQGPRMVQQAADDLDVDAQSKTDKLVSTTLQTFLTARLMNNTAIGAISAKIGLATAGGSHVYEIKRLASCE